jgi:hypothetical protein
MTIKRSFLNDINLKWLLLYFYIHKVVYWQETLFLFTKNGAISLIKSSGFFGLCPGGPSRPTGGFKVAPRPCLNLVNLGEILQGLIFWPMHGGCIWKGRQMKYPASSNLSLVCCIFCPPVTMLYIGFICKAKNHLVSYILLLLDLATSFSVSDDN